MKRFTSLTAILCFIVAVFSSAVHATELSEMYPKDIVDYPDRLEIRKIYELTESENPKNIPRSSFTRDQIMYTYTDILREVIAGEEKKTVTETESITSTKNDIETILKLLPQKKEIVTTDGFSGTLYLNTSTIKSEISGYGSSTNTVSATRSYSNLSSADSQYIPKSITENGITYNLQDIQWQTDNTYNVDDYEVGNRYTAVASYSGTKTSSYVKGYNITADYTGEVSRVNNSHTRYTVIFSGVSIAETKPTTEITTEYKTEFQTEPETELISETESESAPHTELTTESDSEIDPEKKSGFDLLFVIIPVGLVAAAGIAGVLYYLHKRKENNYEENIDDEITEEETVDDGEIGNDDVGDYIDDSGSNPNDGGGL